MSDYVEYCYHGDDNPSGPTGAQLAREISVQLSEVRGSICDLGCGNGYLSRQLAAQGRKVTGIDASASGIRHAQAQAADGARFVRGEIRRDADWVDDMERFDAVVSSEVIEHLYRPADLVETALEILKPGGLLVITTPYHGYWKNLAVILSGRFDRHFDPLWDGGHIKFFSAATMRKLLASHGFADIRFAYSGRCPGLWKSMICSAHRPADIRH